MNSKSFLHCRSILLSTCDLWGSDCAFAIDTFCILYFAVSSSCGLYLVSRLAIVKRERLLLTNSPLTIALGRTRTNQTAASQRPRTAHRRSSKTPSHLPQAPEAPQVSYLLPLPSPFHLPSRREQAIVRRASLRESAQVPCYQDALDPCLSTTIPTIFPRPVAFSEALSTPPSSAPLLASTPSWPPIPTLTACQSVSRLPFFVHSTIGSPEEPCRASSARLRNRSKLAYFAVRSILLHYIKLCRALLIFAKRSQ